MTDEIARLLTLGKRDLEAGYPQYAREYFQKVLQLDADNEIAKQAISEIDAPLRSKPPLRLSGTEETQAEKPLGGGRSITGWIRKEREERARIVAEREKIVAEKREALEDEEMRVTDLSEDEEMRDRDLIGDEDLNGMTTDLAKLLQLQCRQLVRIEAELQKQGEALSKHTRYLYNISTGATFVILLIVVGIVLTMCGAFL